MLAPEGFRSFLFSASILPPQRPHLLELADIKINYRYPDYTGIAPQEVDGIIGDVKAIKGTIVSFEATPLRSLDKGNLVIEKGHTIPLSVEKGRIKAEFTIISSDGFFIEDKSGRFRSRVFKITSEEDKNPKVAITAPTGDVIEVDEKEKIDIYYTAQDDFGLTKLILTWKTKNGESSRSIDQIKEAPTSIEGRFVWDLSVIESDPDEIIEARIKAYDNDTVSGPKFGVSNPIKIKLKNPRRKHEDVLVAVEKVLDELLDVLGDEVEKGRLQDGYLARNQNDFSIGAEEQNLNRIDYTKINIGIMKKAHEGITSKIEKALSSLGRLLETIKSDDFSDYTSFLGLSNMKIRIEDLLYERRDLIPTLSLSNLPRLDGLITREINEFEDDILFLDSTLKGERLRESLVYGKEALSKYNELSELLEKLKQNGDEATRRKIEKKIEELRGLMSQLAEKLGSISGDVYEGFLNPDAFESIDVSGKLDEIMNLTEQGKIAEALNLLGGIKNSLQGMIASLESGFQSFSSASLSKEISKLNEMIARMKSIEKEETSLRRKTEDLKQSLLKAPAKKEKLADFVERERKKIEELKNSRFLKGETSEGQSHQIVKRQEQIEEETGELVKDITEYEDDLPLHPNVGEKLNESKGFMQGASRNLRGKEVSKAISNQEEAIKALKKAREEAEGLLEKYQLSAKGMGPSVPFVLGSGQPRQGPRGVDTGYVEIPPPQESETGKEFKENLLKAIRDGSPEGYSELNKRYYERIVK